MAMDDIVFFFEEASTADKAVYTVVDFIFVSKHAFEQKYRMQEEHLQHDQDRLDHPSKSVFLRCRQIRYPFHQAVFFDIFVKEFIRSVNGEDVDLVPAVDQVSNVLQDKGLADAWEEQCDDRDIEFSPLGHSSILNYFNGNCQNDLVFIYLKSALWVSA